MASRPPCPIDGIRSGDDPVLGPHRNHEAVAAHMIRSRLPAQESHPIPHLVDRWPHEPPRFYGLHSAHGFFPAWIASSRVLYRTRFFPEIFAADLHPALWKTAEFFDATYPSETTAAGAGSVGGAERWVSEYPFSLPALRLGMADVGLPVGGLFPGKPPVPDPKRPSSLRCSLFTVPIR